MMKVVTKRFVNEITVHANNFGMFAEIHCVILNISLGYPFPTVIWTLLLKHFTVLKMLLCLLIRTFEGALFIIRTLEY
jgi:hypothetical protein